MQALMLAALAVVAAALAVPSATGVLRRRRNARRRAGRPRTVVRDPGRERRAERKARALLESTVNAEEWAMYRDLGFIRVEGVSVDGGRPGYAYLIYPHKPIVAYMPQTKSLLNEYCVEFPDLSEPLYSSKLPDSDDVLAKWLALKGDESRLIRNANMHLPGRQVDPRHVRRDLWRLAEWERTRRDIRLGGAS